MTTPQKPAQVLADARHVLERARANLSAFAKKKMDKRFFNEFEQKLRQAEEAAASPAPPSKADKAIRAIYDDALAGLARDAARARLPEVPTEADLGDPVLRGAANRAGITPARLRAVGMLRASLAEPAEKELDPAPLLAAIAGETARVREVAAAVLKKSPARLAEFAHRTAKQGDKKSAPS